MRKIETAVPGVLIIEPRVFKDERGFFVETYRRDRFREMGIDCEFVQDNHSRSTRGTLRGLHYQTENPQAKLCRVIQGEVLDVAVDIRRGSPTFGKWVSVLLSSDNFRQIFVPEGFAHGFVTLSDTAEFLYKCSDIYYPEHERGIIWNDPALAIDWRISEPLLSKKDQLHPTLASAAEADLPRYTRK